MKKDMIEQIQTGKSRHVKEGKRCQNVHIVEYGGQEYPVVYSNKYKEIASFFDPDWVE
jgi:hypothetical protein